MNGSELKKKRKSLGLTQTQFADFLGGTRVTLARWEKQEIKIPKIAEPAIEKVDLESPEFQAWVVTLMQTDGKAFARLNKRVCCNAVWEGELNEI